jgi:hypothetical protein
MNFSISPPRQAFLSTLSETPSSVDQMIFSPGISDVSEERQTGAVI